MLDGAQIGAMPVVPWAKLTTGRLVEGGFPIGAISIPVLRTGLSFKSVDL